MCHSIFSLTILKLKKSTNTSESLRENEKKSTDTSESLRENDKSQWIQVNIEENRSESQREDQTEPN